MIRRNLPLIAIAVVTVSSCDRASAISERVAHSVDAAPGANSLACITVDAARSLSDEVRETSGLARSARDPGLLWTHNDAGNEPILYTIDEAGGLVQRVTVTGAAAVDWEDLEAGRCDSGTCLYIADIGDNDAAREHITVYRIPEPGPAAATSEPAVAFHAKYPDGARDAESLFTDGAGGLFIVTKGRHGDIAVYRFPMPTAAGGTVALERVRGLFGPPDDENDRVTAASASPNGQWVAVRSYRALYIFPMPQMLVQAPAVTVEPLMADLTALGEPQGEGVVIADDGAVWLSSEAANRDDRPRLSRLQCSLPGD